MHFCYWFYSFCVLSSFLQKLQMGLLLQVPVELFTVCSRVFSSIILSSLSLLADRSSHPLSSCPSLLADRSSHPLSVESTAGRQVCSPVEFFTLCSWDYAFCIFSNSKVFLLTGLFILSFQSFQSFQWLPLGRFISLYILFCSLNQIYAHCFVHNITNLAIMSTHRIFSPLPQGML